MLETWKSLNLLTDGGQAWSTAVRLRPDWKRRLLIIVCGMVAVCVGSGVLVLFAGAQSQVPQSPDAIPLVVIGSLGPYNDDDIGSARAVMAGPMVTDMLSRLRLIRQHLMLVHSYYQLHTDLPAVTTTGDTATVVAPVYDKVEAPGNTGVAFQSGAFPWTFETVRRSFPQPGWFLISFTAPDECQVYSR